ncbi:hypothetical protein [Amycolatopsis taiwanensis]|uniref:Uncharacterized protein n=1 Tax=Amycolatopsis taiwanensis TaxID=342230 RepID=A0A9W6VEM9_9PSEU|nr:hypothetical protein [Amycolatopsis taiwanensis]GLY65930.1 hypothetical protein Atai01_25490 [Amycolatopsis taiwanensis]
MNHILAELATQDADLLPTRLTLGTFDGGVFPGFGEMINVHATNLAIGTAGPAIAIQNINVG